MTNLFYTSFARDFRRGVQSGGGGGEPATGTSTSTATSSPTPTGTYFLPVVGPTWSSDTIGNLKLGGNGTIYISKRIQIPKTGSIVSNTWYAVLPDDGKDPPDFDNYGHGTRGTVRISIQTNNTGTTVGGGGVPSGTIIGGSSNFYTETNFNTRFTDPNGSQRSVFLTGTFPTPVSVTAGQIVHIVFQQTDSNPTQNYVSTDDLVGAAANGHPAHGHNFRILRGSPGSWGVSTTRYYFPVYEIVYSDGEVFSNPYINGPRPNNSTNNHSSHQQITGTTWVRQTYTPRRNERVERVAFWARPSSGSGNVVCEIRNSSDTVLATASMPSGSYWNTGGFMSSAAEVDRWLNDAAFNTPVTLTGGTRYNITFRTTGGLVLTTRCIQDGTVTRWYPNQADRDPGWLAAGIALGRAEYSTNSGDSWTGFTSGSNSSPATNQSNQDLSFYFLTDQAD